ncbi:hypothetical protein ECANGB1_1283 [Enterospora canceri]|uniref:Uncharacterized protein n=1 Tax=Enterospora canceri TaxID=1081671 RepID=A0A1Y1S740_9MICR|nr:hypothetical protein ECANGB1_1283 [Enterospora canceri]
MAQIFKNTDKCKLNDGHKEREFYKDPRAKIDGQYDKREALEPKMGEVKHKKERKREEAGYRAQTEEEVRRQFQ